MTFYDIKFSFKLGNKYYFKYMLLIIKYLLINNLEIIKTGYNNL